MWANRRCQCTTYLQSRHVLRWILRKTDRPNRKIPTPRKNKKTQNQIGQTGKCQKSSGKPKKPKKTNRTNRKVPKKHREKKKHQTMVCDRPWFSQTMVWCFLFFCFFGGVFSMFLGTFLFGRFVFLGFFCFPDAFWHFPVWPIWFCVFDHDGSTCDDFPPCEDLTPVMTVGTNNPCSSVSLWVYTIGESPDW